MADIRINSLPSTATSFNTDDYIAIDGASGGTRKMLAATLPLTDVTLGGSSGPSVKSTLSARAPRQGLVFDGTAGADVTVPATTDASVAFWINPTLSGSTLFPVIGAIGSYSTIYVSTSGKIINEGDATGSTAAFASGKWGFGVVTKSGNTVTYYVNGVAAGTYTQTNPWNASGKIGKLSSNTFLSALVGPYVYNRALSASEVVALYEAGAPAGADYNSASNTAINTSTASNLTYDTFSGASATGFTAVGLGGDKYAVSQPNVLMSQGTRYRVTLTLTLTSGQAPYVYLDVPSGGSYLQQLAAGSNTIELTAVGTSATGRLVFKSTAATNYTVASLSVTRLGLLLAPDAAQAGGGYVWNDQSGNLAQIVLPSSGVQWNLPSVAGQRIRGTTSTNGNQQLLGASVLLPAECQITHVRARARSGTPTITIGTASGGAQIVASVALSTTWLNCTIALTGGIVSSADDIWVGSNSTDVVETDIAFQPLDF